MPPSRYRVVEQGRRLVVIDTLRGEQPPRAARPRMPAAAAPRPGAAPRFTTSAFFDSKAPRTVVLDDAAGKRLGGLVGLAITAVILCGVFVTLFPAGLFVAAFFLATPGARNALRRISTRVIDQAAG